MDNEGTHNVKIIAEKKKNLIDERTRIEVDKGTS